MPVATINVPDIGDINVPEDNYLENWNSDSEKDFLDIVRRHLPKGGTLVDVGANIGLLSILATKLQPDANIIAIEASPAMANFVRANFRDHGLDNAEIHNAAVSSSLGSTYFVEGGPYGHMVREEQTRFVSDAIVVPMKSLDSILGERRVDIVKIDVEGFEWGVIDGANEMDRRWKPVYYLEFNLWTLMMYGRVNPPDFLLYLRQRFAHLSYFMDGYWQEINDASQDHVIWRGMHGHLDNIFVTNDLNKKIH